MEAVSKNIYFDVLNDIIAKYSNTYHRTIKMKPIDVKSYSYPECFCDQQSQKDSFMDLCY